MDRTRNLLDRIGGCSHPAEHPAPFFRGETVEPPRSMETVATASSDSIESLEQSIVQELGATKELSNPVSNHGVSNHDVSNDEVAPYAIDPYVAEPMASAGKQGDPPKPVSEILKTLNGYQDEIDRREEPNGSGPRSKSNSSSDLAGVQLGGTNTSELTANLLEMSEMETENRIEVELKDASSEGLSSVVTKAPHATTVEILPTENRATETIENLENLLSDSMGDSDQPEFDIHFFDETPEIVTGAPDPIRNAFDDDPDYFDYVPAEIRRDRRRNVDLPVLMGPQFRRKCDGPDITQPPSVLHDTAMASMPTAENQSCFWVNDGELISIDGNDGFHCIDLACFDISAASFQASRIEIQCDDGLSFQIEYCNVSHALFANGVEVELAMRTFTSLPS